MRALKALVVIMGVMLVVGTVALVVAIIKRKPVDGHPPVAIAGASTLPDTAVLALPAGAHIDTMISAGDRLVLHSTSASGEAVIIVDPTTGTIVRTLEIRR